MKAYRGFRVLISYDFEIYNVTTEQYDILPGETTFFCTGKLKLIPAEIEEIREEIKRDTNSQVVIIKSINYL